MIKTTKIAIIILLTFIILFLILLGFLTATEFKPEKDSHLFIQTFYEGSVPSSDDGKIKILSWNIGYCGLDKSADFFMDGGKNVNPKSREKIEENMNAINNFILKEYADINLLQEVDKKASRTKKIDEYEFFIQNSKNPNSAYTANFLCKFVPYPFPPIGQIDAGLATYTKFPIKEAERHSLPCPFKYPVRIANMKRCLLETRFRLENGKDLVVFNLHLEAYDDGEGKIAQTKKLIEVLETEYSKGNYVIAGGDFNQAMYGTMEKYPVQNADLWAPSIMENDILPDGWKFYFDDKTPTCRLLNKPYTDKKTHQFYVIDGFIVSPNVEVESVETIDLNFENSDHNPVVIEISIK